MTEPYSGGCACGAVRYRIADEPVFQNHCQCGDCQGRSGTGHGSYLTFPDRGRVELRGQASTWRMAGDSGNVKNHAFCGVCGSPVHLTFDAMPQLFTVHATSLDDPARFRPQAVTYGIAGHAWDRLDPTLATFERMPPA